jgi:hypothetical protein
MSKSAHLGSSDRGAPRAIPSYHCTPVDSRSIPPPWSGPEWDDPATYEPTIPPPWSGPEWDDPDVYCPRVFPEGAVLDVPGDPRGVPVALLMAGGGG